MLMLGAIVCVLATYQAVAIAASPNLPASVQYANSWAVEVTGGDEKASALAVKHDFIYSGKVWRASELEFNYSCR